MPTSSILRRRLRPLPAAVLALALWLGAAACGDGRLFGLDRYRCRHSYGCVELRGEIVPPPQPWPGLYFLTLRVRALDPEEPVSYVNSAEFGSYTIPLARRHAPPSRTGDTVTVWVVADMRDASGPPQIGVPLPRFAADSVVRTLRFAPTGSLVPADTLTLRLRPVGR